MRVNNKHKPQLPIDRANSSGPKLLGIIHPNYQSFEHWIPECDSYSSSGGYRILSPSGYQPAYAPLDLSVALFESFLKGVTIYKLKEFFLSYPHRQSEYIIRINISVQDKEILSHTIVEWKQIIKDDASIKKLLEDNAPLTFKY